MAGPSTAYRLVVSGHKGGSAKTTTALLLAAAAAGRGLATGFVDRCADGAALRILEPVGGAAPVGSPWPRVPYFKDVDGSGALPAEFAACKLLVVDAGRLGREASRRALSEADGVLLTSAADLVSLQTFPWAAGELAAAREANPRLELLGLLITAWDAQDPAQAAALEAFQSQFGPLLRDPPTPYQRTLYEWPLHPGSPPPAGPATNACRAVFDRLPSRFAPALQGVASHD